MRCPYCNGLTPDRTAYCINCGRDLTTNRSQRAPQQAPRPFSPAAPPPPPQRPAYPYNPPQQRVPGPPETIKQPLSRPTVYPPVQTSTARPTAAPAPARPNVAPRMEPARVARPTPPPVEPVQATEPTPPVSFPPKTVQQLQALSKDGLEYKEISQEEAFGKKKLVCIQFRRCTGWQQVATLLKALDAYDNPKKYNTVIIQGVYNQESNIHEYTNGQLIFDRNVRLGSRLQNRYQIETDNGYSTEAQRIVLSE